VVKIGGQSMIDRGRSAVLPIIEEVVANSAQPQDDHRDRRGHPRRGTRYSVGIDLGMPTGVLSVLGTFVSMQNARMIHYLLARHGIPFIEPVQFPPASRCICRSVRRACSSACLRTRSGSPIPRSGGFRPHRTDNRRLPGQ